jgi:hypothetical protein
MLLGAPPGEAPDTTVADHGASSLPLVTIKAIHSAIFLAMLSAILWLLWTGIVGRRDRSVALAASLVAGEAAVFLDNDGVCPLTPLAERYGAPSGTGGVADIFLPAGLARTIPQWSTGLLILAGVLHLARAVERRG